MKVHELITQLQTMPPDASVVVMDSERVAYEACGEPSHEGLYYGFEVDLDTEMFFLNDDDDNLEDIKPVPTVVISFESDYVEQKSEWVALDMDYKEMENRLKLKTDAIDVVHEYIVAASAPKQQCYKGNGECDCPGLCRENC